MASIFRQKYTKKNAETGERETRESKKWYVRYKDESGKLKTRAGYPDKAMTKQLAARLERDVMRRQEGLADPFEEHRSRALTEHLEDFRTSLLAKERTESYVKTKVSRIRKGFEVCGFVTTDDIEQSKVEAWLSAQRTAGRAAQTVNHALGAMKQFTKFLVASGRMANDPLLYAVTKFNVAADRRRERRALTSSELESLLQASESAQPFRGLSGEDRTVLYLTAVNTGLRRGELASLTPSSFSLDAEPATVRVPAGMSKNRKETLLPLHPSFVARVRAWLEGKRPDQPCWPGTWTDRSSQMLQVDLAAAQIPYRDSAGCVFDFHALRHHMVTNLARNGVHPSVAKQLARHSTIELTMNTYTHLALEEAAAALDQVDEASLGLTPAETDGLTPPLTRNADPTRQVVSPADTEGTGSGASPECRKSQPSGSLGDRRPPESSDGPDLADDGEAARIGFLMPGSWVRIPPGVPTEVRWRPIDGRGREGIACRLQGREAVDAA